MGNAGCDSTKFGEEFWNCADIKIVASGGNQPRPRPPRPPLCQDQHHVLFQRQTPPMVICQPSLENPSDHYPVIVDLAFNSAALNSSDEIAESASRDIRRREGEVPDDGAMAQ